MASKKKSLSVVMKKAESAWETLERNQVSQADKQRAWDVLAGMKALDDEQARVKGAIEDLVLEFFNPNAPNDTTNELLRRLLAIVLEAADRPPAEQAALDDIARALAKEDKALLQRQPVRVASRQAVRVPSGQNE